MAHYYYKQQQIYINLIQNNFMNLKPNPEDQGAITKQFLKKLCKTDFKNYYSTPYLNDILYLHYKGFEKLSSLEEYTGLKVVYLEGNSFKVIEGLDTLVNLRCLYLQQNLIKEISGLSCLTELVNLNLSDNLIQKVENLGALAKLSNLQLKRNRIGLGGLDDVLGILECPNISALDISDNRIQTEQFVTEVLMKMPNIHVIYMQNNDFTKKISHYRKSIISRVPIIKYIDDKPVFQDQKRYSQAWARGGLQEERKERVLYRKQKEEQQIRQHNEFREMMERYKEQGRKKKEAESQSESESNSISQQQSLETYKSPLQSQNSERESSKKSQTEYSQKSESMKGEEESEKEQENEEEKEQEKRKVRQEKEKMKEKEQQKKKEKEKEKIREKEKAEVEAERNIIDKKAYLDELD